MSRQSGLELLLAKQEGVYDLSHNSKIRQLFQYFLFPLRNCDVYLPVVICPCDRRALDKPPRFRF